ncbi:uncharacterized protein LOC131433802 [Malaya genurostris]|uniref:uncharacterized protein LOC131433802 n=1 Tax=Malaya genurostris TaxID=325434 RepID=UPI0026F3974A|nr:uncharacterized protein LOC131433802 [Malaya genurostris]
MEKLKQTRAFRKIHNDIRNNQVVYDDLVVKINKLYYYLGMNFLDSKHSFCNPRYLFLSFMTVSFFYADIESAILADDMAEFFYNLTVLGFGALGLAKIYLYVFRRLDLKALTRKASSVFARHRNSPRQNEIMKDGLTLNLLIRKFLGIMYRSALAVVVSFGVIISVYSGERTLSFGFKFSFIDDSHWPGFIITYIYQTIAVSISASSMYLNDNIIVIIFMNSLSMFDCMISDLKELTKLSQSEKNSKNRRDIEHLMKSLIQQHQDLLEYLDLANDVFSWYFLMILFCLISAMSFQIITLVWSEELTVEIYNTKWYDLDDSTKKCLKLLLFMSQNTAQISYRFGAMNIDTYVNVIEIKCRVAEPVEAPPKTTVTSEELRQAKDYFAVGSVDPSGDS